MAFLPGDAQAGKLVSRTSNPVHRREGALLFAQAGVYLINCIGGNLPLLYSWVAANTAGKSAFMVSRAWSRLSVTIAGHTKKVCINALVLMSFCLGNIIGQCASGQAEHPLNNLLQARSRFSNAMHWLSYLPK